MASRIELKALTGLRFFAALVVVFDHFAGWFALSAPAGASVAERAYCKILFDSGAEAVSLFYVLSGFVLVYAYERNGRLATTKATFYVARFARIYPAYLVGFALGAIPYFAWGAHSNPWLMGFLTLSLTQTWLALDSTQWNPPGWSVSVEAFLYAVFPFIIAPLSKIPSRYLAILIAIFYAGTFSGGVCYLYVSHATGGFTAINPLFRIFEFAIGICAGLLFLRDAWHVRIIPTVAILAVLFIAMTAVADVSYLWRHNGLLSPIFALLIYRLAVGGGFTCWLLSSYPVVLLGEASYALYIIHWPIQQVFSHALDRTTAGFVYLPFVVLASIAVHILIERPARTFIRRSFNREIPRARQTGVIRET